MADSKCNNALQNSPESDTQHVTWFSMHEIVLLKNDSALYRDSSKQDENQLKVSVEQQ